MALETAASFKEIEQEFILQFGGGNVDEPDNTYITVYLMNKNELETGCGQWDRKRAW